MNIIQATPSIYAAKPSGSIKTTTHWIQREALLPPSFSSIVTLGGRLPTTPIYNERGLLESSADDRADGSQEARKIAAKDAALDESTRLSASIAANTPYAYAVSLLFVNVAAASIEIAKKLPKAIPGVQPVSPAFPSAAARTRP